MINPQIVVFDYFNLVESAHTFSIKGIYSRSNTNAKLQRTYIVEDIASKTE